MKKGECAMRLGKLTIGLAAASLFAVATLAQGPGSPPGGFGGFGGGLANMIGQNKQLQDEFKMDKEQVDKLTAALTKARDDMKDDLAKLRDRNTSQDDRAEIMKKFNEANAKAVESVLKPEQAKRLHQIENQQAGLGMFTKADVQKTLNLSDAQKDNIKEISENLQKEMRELGGPGGFGGPGGGRGGNPAEFAKKRQGLQKEAMDNVLKGLNDDQKAAVKDLTGAPFELRFEGFGFGGGAFGPGGPGGFGGFGGPPQPGQILAPAVQDRLKLTDEQKKKLEELQKDVDGKLGKILTDDQKKQLKDMQEAFGRGGPGGRPGGPGGRPGGPGGPGGRGGDRPDPPPQ
jgi:Spy/CpxP family protein refolding chaperone